MNLRSTLPRLKPSSSSCELAARAPAITPTVPVSRGRRGQRRRDRGTCHLPLQAGYHKLLRNLPACTSHDRANQLQEQLGSFHSVVQGPPGSSTTYAQVFALLGKALPCRWAVVPAPYGPVRTQVAKKLRQEPQGLNGFGYCIYPVPGTLPVPRFRCLQCSEADASVVATSSVTCHILVRPNLLSPTSRRPEL